MRQPSRTAYRSGAPAALRHIGLAATTLVAILLTAVPSKAEFCGVTHDLIEGRIISRFFTDDLVFAGANRSEAQTIEALGTFKLNLKSDSGWDSFLAELGLYRVFVTHVFHGDKALEGHHITFMRLQECEDWGCTLDETSLEDLKRNTSRLKHTLRDKTEQEEKNTSTALSPPYRLYFLKQYTPQGSIDLGNANSLWMYLSDAFGLRFYQRRCGTFGIADTAQDIEVRKRLDIVENSRH